MGADKVNANLQAWADRRKAATVALAQVWAGKLEGIMKSNAPWTDRTANARNGLFGSTAIEGNTIFIRCGHSVEYGVFLELANEGRFAIVKPTLDANSAKIIRDYEDVWTK